MSKVAIVTDSTAYIPPEMLKGLPVSILPLHLIWGDHLFLDGVDIQPVEFYRRLQVSKENPSTSQATPMTFRDQYKRLLDEDYQIFSIHISSKLSGTIDSAIQARSELPQDRIMIFDSMATSMALGFQVLAVARAAAQGATLQDCEAIATQARENCDVYFAVSTLEYLHRGGRIGGAAAFVGTALNLKPILKLHDGKVEAVEKIRTMSKAIDRLTYLVQNRLTGKRSIHLAAVHANAEPEANALLERVRACFDVSLVSDAVVTDVSPVVGTHAGPGTIGIAFMYGI
jgi:DegV family protein with EDD domain